MGRTLGDHYQEELATTVCAANAAQYHQATNTPFASEPCEDIFTMHVKA